MNIKNLFQLTPALSLKRHTFGNAYMKKMFANNREILTIKYPLGNNELKATGHINIEIGAYDCKVIRNTIIEYPEYKTVIDGEYLTFDLKDQKFYADSIIDILNVMRSYHLIDSLQYENITGEYPDLFKIFEKVAIEELKILSYKNFTTETFDLHFMDLDVPFEYWKMRNECIISRIENYLYSQSCISKNVERYFNTTLQSLFHYKERVKTLEMSN